MHTKISKSGTGFMRLQILRNVTEIIWGPNHFPGLRFWFYLASIAIFWIPNGHTSNSSGGGLSMNICIRAKYLSLTAGSSNISMVIAFKPVCLFSVSMRIIWPVRSMQPQPPSDFILEPISGFWIASRYVNQVIPWNYSMKSLFIFSTCSSEKQSSELNTLVKSCRATVLEESISLELIIPSLLRLTLWRIEF